MVWGLIWLEGLQFAALGPLLERVTLGLESRGMFTYCTHSAKSIVLMTIGILVWAFPQAAWFLGWKIPCLFQPTVLVAHAHWEAYYGHGSLPLHNLVSDSANPHYVSDPLPRPFWDNRSTTQLVDGYNYHQEGPQTDPKIASRAYRGKSILMVYPRGPGMQQSNNKGRYTTAADNNESVTVTRGPHATGYDAHILGRPACGCPMWALLV